METVFLLWYVREWEEGEDTELLIGAYRSEPDATGAIERLKSQPGFVTYPEGFQIHAYNLGEDHWTEGFARLVDSKSIFEKK